MSDDRFENRSPKPMRKFSVVARTAFDQAEKEKFEKGVDIEPAKWCEACSNSGMEQVRDEDGYNVGRRCTQCRVPF